MMQDKKAILQLHYDDSSDEENEDEGQEYGQVSAQFNQQITNDPILAAHVGDLRASFDIFYYGLMIYHAPAVRTTYASSKCQYLSQSIIPTDDKLREWLWKVVVDAIQKELLIKDHRQAFAKFIHHSVVSLTPQIQNFIDVCLNNLRVLIRSAYHGNSLTDVILEAFNQLSSAIADFIDDQENYSCLALGDFTPRPHVTENNLYNNQAIRAWILNKCIVEIGELNQVHLWVIQNGFPTLKSVMSPGKKISSSDATKKICDKILGGYQLTNTQQYYIGKIKELTSATSPESFLMSVKSQFLLARLRVLVDSERLRVGSILQQDQIVYNADLAQSAFVEIADLLDDFIPCDQLKFRETLLEQFVMADILSEFCVLLKRTSNVLEKDISRQTLPIFFQHTVNSSVEHIVSLKLTNRSIVRTYRNQSQPSLLGGDKEENQDFGWKFPASGTYLGIERNRITNNARTALVPMQTMSNAYSDISVKITTINKCLHTNDQQMGLWVREVLQCKQLTFNLPLTVRNREDLIMFVIQIAHLLGGTECMRYPGALIQHQMALDLIVNGKLTWNEALDPTKAEAVYLPMSMIKATNVSRGLIVTYAKTSKYKHHYPGDGLSIDTNEVKNFIAAEKRLSDKWFRFYKNTAEIPTGYQLSEAIKEAIPQWYPGLKI